MTKPSPLRDTSPYPSTESCVYVFLAYTTDHDLVGAFGSREDADAAAKEYLKPGDCEKNFNSPNISEGKLEGLWSWANDNGEVTIEMTKLQ